MADFATLVSDAQACRRCPSMEGRRRVLSLLNGPENSRLLFIAEAPGRLGAERTGIPFSGDQAGRNFDRLLMHTAFTRSQVFITNAVLCNPQDQVGRNRPPTSAELRNCSRWLVAQIEVIDPLVIAPLGQVALRALALIEPHGLMLARDVARLHSWRGRCLFPLYHPAFRALRYRSWAQQVQDWQTLGSATRKLVGAIEPYPPL